MDARHLRAWQRRLSRTPLGRATAEFGTTLGRAPQPAGGLLVVGAPEHEPWHFVAHLAEEARRHGHPTLAPTWLRWSAPPDAPAHLGATVDRLAEVHRRDTVVIVTEHSGFAPLLERVNDARRLGALILSVHHDDDELLGLSNESIQVPRHPCDPTFDVVQHVVTEVAANTD